MGPMDDTLEKVIFEDQRGEGLHGTVLTKLVPSTCVDLPIPAFV